MKTCTYYNFNEYLPFSNNIIVNYYNYDNNYSNYSLTNYFNYPFDIYYNNLRNLDKSTLFS